MLSIQKIFLLSWLLLAGVVVSIGHPGFHSPIRASQDRSNEGWPLLTSFDFPILVASDSSGPNGGATRRRIYLFLEAKRFSRKNLTVVFQTMSSKTPRTHSLEITVFSDRLMLTKAIDAADIPDFWDDPRGRAGKRAFIQKYYHAPTGYYRAYYTRSFDMECFRYSKDPDSEQYTWIDMRVSPKEDLVMTLIEAVKAGDIPTMKALIGQGVNRNVRARTGNGLIRHTPRRNKDETIKCLIQGGENVDEPDEYDRTPLMRAADEGDKEVAAVLLDAGASIDRRGPEGKSPLLVAAEQGHPEVLELLLERKADPNQTSSGLNVTPLILAAENDGSKKRKDAALKRC